MENVINITLIDRNDVKHELEVPTDMNLNIMEISKAEGLPVKGTCGGMALCSTCHCYLESETELLPPTEDEEDMLDQAFFVEDNSRLGCQIYPRNEDDGMVLRLAAEGEDLG